MPDSIFNYFGTVAVIFCMPALGVLARVFGFPFKRIAKWYAYVAVFAVVVVVNSIFFPFIGGKDYFFRFAVELGLVAWLLWWAFEAKDGEAKQMIREAFRKPIVRAVSAFAAAYLLAALFALDAHAAFWSNYERGEGAFQMLHYYAFFLLLVMFFKHEEDWKNIFKFSLVAACGMIGYGIVANLGWDPSFISTYAGGTPPAGWWNQLIYGRFEGSLGNPAYVAPYLMFAMFFAGYLWAASKISGALTTAKAWGYAALIAIFLLFFYASQTRGAFLGLLGGLFVFLGYLTLHERMFIRKLAATIVIVPSIVIFAWYHLALGHSYLSSFLTFATVVTAIGIPTFAILLMFSEDQFLRKWSRVVFEVFLAVAVIAVVATLIIGRGTFDIGNVPGSRLVHISTSDTTAQTRFWVWGEAWKGFLARPVFGWGPENFTAVFDKYFNPNFYVPGQNTETWFDRAHSVYFDYLAETGIVGLLAYLSIFAMFAREFFRRRRLKAVVAEQQRNHAAHKIQDALMLAAPVAYLVQGIAIFDVLPMYIPLFLFLAFSTYYYSKTQ